LYTSLGVVPADGPEAFERAIKVVWASAFNYAAFVEREFYRVDQRLVRMGVLVHASFDDEAANGVALTQNAYSEIRPAYFINAQIGDISVTNPSGAAVPEQILWYTWYTTPEYEVLSRSSLRPTQPVLTVAQYTDLAEQLVRLRNHFNPLWCQIPGTSMLDPNCAIDVEWKLAPDGQVWVKQARPLRGGGAEPDQVAP
jgi:pyruvate,water dikinase